LLANKVKINLEQNDLKDYQLEWVTKKLKAIALREGDARDILPEFIDQVEVELWQDTIKALRRKE